MYDYVRATSGVAVLFFVSLVIFGNWILLNLFLAILLSNFQEDDRVEDEPEEPEHTIVNRLKRTIARLIRKQTSGRADSLHQDARPADFEDEEKDSMHRNPADPPADAPGEHGEGGEDAAGENRPPS